jgi:hypothetical protein
MPRRRLKPQQQLHEASLRRLGIRPFVGFGSEPERSARRQGWPESSRDAGIHTEAPGNLARRLKPRLERHEASLRRLVVTCPACSSGPSRSVPGQ